MQKLLIVSEMTPTVTAYLDLGDKLVGVTITGDYLLLANMQPLPAEKPKQRRRKDVNGKVPRGRPRKALGHSGDPADRAYKTLLGLDPERIRIDPKTGNVSIGDKKEDLRREEEEHG